MIRGRYDFVSTKSSFATTKWETNWEDSFQIVSMGDTEYEVK